MVYLFYPPAITSHYVDGHIGFDNYESIGFNVVDCWLNILTQEKRQVMNVAVTGAAGFLGQSILPKLSRTHKVVATDLHPQPGTPAIATADVRDPGAMQDLCAQVDAVIHLACARWDNSLSDSENETCILNTRLKGTYNLLQAAHDAKLKRVIQISDLCILEGYAADLMVSEDFLPLPDTSAYQQSVYLSEWVGREFARQQPGHILTLRLGKLVDSQRLTADARYADGWLDLDDATDAILHGLEHENLDRMGQWALYNLAADVPNNRYSLLKIQSDHYGFFPRQDFATWREGI
jgi:nucleoside-diphosphate-sugar epimerase